LAAVRFSFILYSFDGHTSDNGGVLVRTDPPNAFGATRRRAKAKRRLGERVR
jgi:hypothetical protein